jgi:hypothetical protein
MERYANSLWQPKPSQRPSIKGEPIWDSTLTGYHVNTKTSSRRISQRRYKRKNKKTKIKKQNTSYEKILIQKLNLAKQRCQFNFGFYSDPQRTLQKNFNFQITKTHSPLHAQPSNLAFHNLCTYDKLPLGTRQLLGLNLNFCLASKNSKTNLNKTILRMARSIRINSYLKQQSLNENAEYHKQIYICNSNWHPPPASILIENQITAFEKLLKAKQQELEIKNQNSALLNLTPLQKSALIKLRQNNSIIIKPTDKNLGPAIMDAETYTKQILQNHLLTNNYQQLSSAEAQQRYNAVQNDLKNLITSNRDAISKPELTYFQRSFKQRHRLPIFYGLPKVHKHPIALRPVVSSVNSFLSVFSNWLDFKMKELLPLVKSYTKNSFDVLQDLHRLQIPSNAVLFSADAKSMYTNIDTKIGLQSFKSFLELNKDLIPNNFPTNLFLKILETVMSNNIFSFADTKWLQLSGTAMGTPTACAYATITYGHHENTEILTKFTPNLLYYRRYIDDIFGVWVPPESNQTAVWKNFESTLNAWGSLEWIIEKPSYKTVFLDLNIELINSKIQTSTFQKSLNLYLYLPPRSAHPPSCFKGLIAGEMRRYWLQNNQTGFISILEKLIIRLTERGHQLKDIIPILQHTATQLNNAYLKQPSRDEGNTLYIHQTYHPQGIQRGVIRTLYNKTLKPILDFDRMTVAISRPRNLRDILTKASLTLPPHLNVQQIINELQE